VASRLAEAKLHQILGPRPLARRAACRIGCSFAGQRLSNRADRSHRDTGAEDLVVHDHDPPAYRPRMNTRLPGGTVHSLPDDLRGALLDNTDSVALWLDITPLARNEFSCWVDSARRPVTRQRRIVRTREELPEGTRRPCWWEGCGHRTRKGN